MTKKPPHEIIRWTPERQRKIDEWKRHQALFALLDTTEEKPEKVKPDLVVVKKPHPD